MKNKKEKIKWMIVCEGSQAHLKTFYENCAVEAWQKAKKKTKGMKFIIMPIR